MPKEQSYFKKVQAKYVLDYTVYLCYHMLSETFHTVFFPPLEHYEVHT